MLKIEQNMGKIKQSERNEKRQKSRNYSETYLEEY